MLDNILDIMLVLLFLVLVIVSAVLLWRQFFRSVTIFEGQTALKYDHGRLVQRLVPGYYIYRHNTTRIDVYDIRPIRLDIPGQEILTRDKGQIKLSLSITYQITDPELLEKNYANYMTELYSKLQLTLRDLVSLQDLDTILSERKLLQDELTKALVETETVSGLKILSIQVRDFMLSGELKRVYQDLLKVRQEAQISLEKARGESATLRSLANAAQMLDKNPALMNLRLIQAMESTEGNTFVINQDEKK